MDLRYLVKEIKYYHQLGEGHLKRVFYKFLFSKTILRKIVNIKFYNFFYRKKIEKFTKEHNPTILQMENTNLCNARCIMCPHNIMKRKQKTMNLSDFKKIVNEVLRDYSIKTLTITGFGEPLIDKGIIEKINYVNKKHHETDIDIYTNASLLTKELTEKLIKCKIHKINFSVNATKRNYKKIMGLNYEVMKKNILYFIKRNKDSEKPILINISLMIMKENTRDIEKFIKFWRPKVDSVMVYRPLEWTGNKKIEIVEPTPFKRKRWPCIPLWQNITIDVEGNVIMCCQDYESAVKFGNVLKQPIKEIMNSAKFNKIRGMHKKNIYSMKLCKDCDNWINSSIWWWVYT